MTVYQHKEDKNLIVCSECAESHTIDLNEYVENAFSECSICGYVDEKAREEYMWWSYKLDTEMRDLSLIHISEPTRRSAMGYAVVGL